MAGGIERGCRECGRIAGLDAVSCPYCGSNLEPVVPDEVEESGLTGPLVPLRGELEPPEAPDPLTPLAAWVRANSVGADGPFIRGEHDRTVFSGSPRDGVLIPWHHERSRPSRGSLGMLGGTLLTVALALIGVLALPALRSSGGPPLNEVAEPRLASSRPPARAPAPRPRQCSRCGRKLEKRSVFCPYCGQKNGLPQAQAGLGPKVGNNRK